MNSGYHSRIPKWNLGTRKVTTPEFPSGTWELERKEEILSWK